MFGGTAAAQEAAIDGVVVAVDDGTALDLAQVELRQGDSVVHAATVDDRGRFRFASVEPGEYELSASRAGYYTVAERLVLRPRQALRLTIELQPEGFVGEEFSVSATARGLDPQRTGSSRVVTTRALDAVPVSAALDVPTLATHALPGAVLGHDNFVHVRGNEMSLHQFINGVSFLDNAHQHFTPGLSPQIFETANLMTGGFPAEFGNRFGGILDVATRSGRSLGGRGSAMVGLGTVDSRDGAFDYGGSAGRWGYYVYGGALHSARFLNPPEPDERHASGRSTRAVAQIDYQGDADLFRVFVAGGDSRFELPNTHAQHEEGRDAGRALQSFTGILSWQRILSSRSLFSVSGYTRTVTDELKPTSDPHTTLADGSRDTRTVGVKADWNQSLGSHRLKAGIDAGVYRMHEALEFDPRAPEGGDGGHHDDGHEAGGHDNGGHDEPHGEGATAPHGALAALSFFGRETNQLVGAYLQDRFAPLARLTVDLGIRLDHLVQVESYTKISPRVGVALHVPQSGSVIRLAYNRLFTPPPLEYALLSSFLGNAADDAHDRTGHIKPYTQDHVEVGLSQQLNRTADVVADVAIYRHAGENAFESSEIADSRLFVPTNFAEARAYGVELGLDVRPQAVSGLSGRIQYALAKVEFIGPVSGGFAAGDHGDGEVIPPAFDQRHTLSSQLLYRRPWRGFRAGTTVRYGSGTPTEQHHDGGPAVFTWLPDHWTVDLNARLAVWRDGDQRVDFEFDVTNVGNTIYAVAKESEVTPLQYAPRRVVDARLRWRF